VRKFEKQKVENKSTYWLIFELIWRDFYKFFAVKHGNAIFMLDGTASGGGGKGGGGGAQWRLDPPALAAWKAGKTVRCSSTL
jgi:deoxyribodipyrimidine photo-lyase